MSDLYRGTILLWSERQAALLRRRAADAGRCDGPHRHCGGIIALLAGARPGSTTARRPRD
jgi:hypothetical protein